MKTLVALFILALSTFLLAADLTKDENQKRANKCGIFEFFYHLYDGNIHGVYISDRHVLFNAKIHRDLGNCSSALLTSFFADWKNATFIGNCTLGQGFILVEHEVIKPGFMCIPSKSIGKDIGTKVLVFHGEAFHNASVRACSISGDTLCLDKRFDGFIEHGGFVYTVQPDFELHGFGIWDKPNESVVRPVFPYLKAICEASGICNVPRQVVIPPVVVTTEEPILTAPEVSSTPEPTTESPAPPPAQPAPPASTDSPAPSTNPPATTLVPTGRTVKTPPVVTVPPVRTTTMEPLLALLALCDDPEWGCSDEDLWSESRPLTAVFVPVLTFLVVYWI